MSTPYPAAPTELAELRNQLYRLSNLLVNIETRMEKLEHLEKRVAKLEENFPDDSSIDRLPDDDD